LPEPPQPTPVTPSPIAISPTPDPTPTLPPLKRTPEQTLISRIQEDVAEVSDQYVGGLIQSVEANFRGSLLTVKVSQSWYELDQNQQNKLANDLLNRATELDFVKLVLVDADDRLLARSPVVGTEMVILKRNTTENYEVLSPPASD
jgi:secreted trypsin-like serine protease